MSPNIIILIIAAYTVFLLGGGIYDLITNPPVLFSTQSRSLFYWPFDLNSQTLSESIMFILFLSVGVVGGYLSFRSTKHRKRTSSILLLVGIIMLIIGFLGAELLINLKI